LGPLCPVSGSQGGQERSDLWGEFYVVQFWIAWENHMTQSRTFLDTEVVIIHRFTCSSLRKKGRTREVSASA